MTLPHTGGQAVTTLRGQHQWCGPVAEAASITSPLNHGPKEEQFLAGMREMAPQAAPSSLFGPVVAVLAPHSRQPVNVVTHTVTDLGEAEVTQARKGVQSTAEGKGPE